MKHLKIFLLVILLFVTRSLSAWGRQGHEAIAKIAQAKLAPYTVIAINSLRGQCNDAGALHPNETLPPFKYIDTNLSIFLTPRVPLDLSLVANWADGWRNREQATAAWHFINLPIGSVATESSVNEFAKSHPCVISAINDQVLVLKDKSRPTNDKLKALFFIVHFVGDAHMPLHCADDGDRGGNDKKAKFFNRTYTLHHIWDDSVLQQQHLSVEALAADSMKQLSTQDIERLDISKPTTWAIESKEVAEGFVYKQYPKDGSVPEYAQEYEDEAFPIAEKQLAKAGFRLAAILNQAFLESMK